MPIYEYECQKCGHLTEVIQSLKNPSPVHCEACGQKNMRQLVSSPAFHLKGQGWYVTDFKDQTKKPDKKETSVKDSKTENSPTAKAEQKDKKVTGAKEATTAVDSKAKDKAK